MLFDKHLELEINLHLMNSRARRELIHIAATSWFLDSRQVAHQYSFRKVPTKLNDAFAVCKSVARM